MPALHAATAANVCRVGAADPATEPTSELAQDVAPHALDLTLRLSDEVAHHQLRRSRGVLPSSNVRSQASVSHL